jgi:hypothetical protein
LLVLVAVGVTDPPDTAFVRCRAQVLAALGHHRGVQQNRDRLGQGVEAIRFQQFHCAVNRTILTGLSHFAFPLDLQFAKNRFQKDNRMAQLILAIRNLQKGRYTTQPELESGNS